MSFFKSSSAALINEFRLLYSYIKCNKLLCGIIIFVALFAYGFPLTHFTLSIDEENALFRVDGAASVWSTQGRFGISFLKIIFHSLQGNSITSTFLGVCGLSFTSIVWAYGIKSYVDTEDRGRNSNVGAIIIASLFLSFPAHSENIGFSIMSFELGVGWVLVSLASILIAKWAILKNDKGYMILGLLLLTFAVSIYQAFLPVFICGVLLITTINLISLLKKNVKISLKDYMVVISKYIFIASTSLVFYKIIDMVISLFIPKTDYVEGFFLWGKEDSLIIIRNLLSNIKNLVIGDLIYGSNIILPSIIVIILIMLTCIYKSVKQVNVKVTAWVTVIFLMGLTMSPFIMPVLLGAPMPIRASFVLSLFISSSWFLLYEITNKNLIRNIIFLLTIITTFYQSQSMSQLFYSDYNRYQQDVVIAHQIGQRIMEFDLGETPPIPVVYLGEHKQMERANIIKQEVLGYSFFEWDGGNRTRIGNFMKSLGYEFISPTEEQRQEAIELAKDLPVWPSKNSVALMNGLIIVNLSEDPDKYKLNLYSDDSSLMAEGEELYNIVFNDESVDYFNDLEFETLESSVILKAGSRDPYISFEFDQLLQENSFRYVMLEIDSGSEGDMQLFLRQENEDYSEKYSGFIKLKKGENRIYCEYQRFMENVMSLRIDPPNKSVVKVKQITFFK